MIVGAFTRFGNTLRFPGAAGEPPRANALRGLAEAFSPPRSLRVFPSLVLHLLPLAIVVRVQKLASNHFISPGKWRVVTPAGIARVRSPRRVVFSRRLRPCPRKASTWSDPGR